MHQLYLLKAFSHVSTCVIVFSIELLKEKIIVTFRISDLAFLKPIIRKNLYEMLENAANRTVNRLTSNNLFRESQICSGTVLLVCVHDR
jgi:predicted aspartyl protease